MPVVTRILSLYRTSKLIKSEINDCQGISVQPPSIIGLTLTKSKSRTPDIRYWLLLWFPAKPEKGCEDECSNSADEIRVLMLAQDVVRLMLEPTCPNMWPWELQFAIRRGQSSSLPCLAKWVTVTHCVLPSNISPGVFVQVAGYSNDIIEDTLDGKRTAQNV